MQVQPTSLCTVPYSKFHIELSSISCLILQLASAKLDFPTLINNYLGL